MPFSSIEAVLADLRQGRMVVLTDDENRENEGDLVLPAQFATPEAITFMLTVARGYLCLSLTEADCDRLDLHPQAAVNTSVRGTAFTISIDGHPRHGFTTGVSARERAKCIQMAIDPAYRADDFVRPGHINPLRARDGGVLVRTGQTEGSIDLCRLAGLTPAACIIEVMRDDGEMARVPDLQKLCEQHNLKMCSVAQIIEYRLARESLVKRLEPVEGALLRTSEGEFRAHLFQSIVDPLPHLVLTAGDVGARPQIDEPVLVRMHRRHLLGDVFGDLDSSPDGPSGDTLRRAMRHIQREGRGAIVYLRTNAGTESTDLESRLQMLRHAELTAAQIAGSDSPMLTHPGGKAHTGNNIPASQRDFGVGGQILRQLGLSKLRLLTNSNRALPGLEAFGLQIVERVPLGRD
ncbi:MAG: 3,4-dihydroxy-2-butanone-4-phosphate synthase [Planctomycetota bacterium]|nr:3,4-dihydroxy-2-butanone-4-phosphate synthase [Planctomycetota bacterium]